MSEAKTHRCPVCGGLMRADKNVCMYFCMYCGRVFATKAFLQAEKFFLIVFAITVIGMLIIFFASFGS